MICLKIEYVGTNREIVEKLTNVLNKTVYNFCVVNSQEFVIFNDVKIVGIPTKVIE
jgi:hypothetical protein